MKDSHFKFDQNLHSVHWRGVLKSNTPFLNKDRVDYLLSIAGAFSLNPLLLISSVHVDENLKEASTDREYENGIRKTADSLARLHLEHGQQYDSPARSVSNAFLDDGYKLKMFMDIYTKLHIKYSVPLANKTDNLMRNERDVDLNNTMQWPWELGSCWEVGPTHSGSVENMVKYIPASIDMGPTLYNDWKFNYDFLGSNGSVVASHDGLVYIHSTCSLEIKYGAFSTYYSHISVSPGLKNNMQVRKGEYIGKIEVQPDKALCLCDWEKASYSCSTGPHLHWEVRRDGRPISLDNMVVGGIRIRAGKYDRDASCSDPEHCLLARDTLDTPCATYFIDADDNIYCPSVRGNTGMHNY